MKVKIHNYDMILKISIDGGVEIGSVPKGVGLERMRWTGSKLVDLINLDVIWVEFINGLFRLHSIETPYSQLVEMQYKDRKKLWNDNGTYKIKSDDQIKTETNLEYRRSHYPLISDQIGEIMKYLATKDDLPDELQELVDKIDTVKDTYPKVVEKMESI